MSGYAPPLLMTDGGLDMEITKNYCEIRWKVCDAEE